MSVSNFRDYTTITDRINSVAKTKSLHLEMFGELKLPEKRYPLYRLVINPEAPKRVLISAGIHGDEPAGVEAICRWVEEGHFQSFKNQWEVTVLPCLNPSGFELGTRENVFKKDLNREFKLDNPSQEVVIAKKAFSKNFNLTLELHEDIDSSGYYLFQKDKPGSESDLGCKIIVATKKIMPTNLGTEIDDIPAEGGIISRLKEPEEMEWWPMALYSCVKGTTSCFTLETSTHFDMEIRVQAHLAAINTALKYFD